MTKQLTWQAVALLAVVAGAVVALATLTAWDSTQIIAVAALLAGVGGGAAVGGAVAGGVSQRVDQLHAETSAQTPILETVARRVNGDLDDRIAAAMEEAAETGAARAISAMRGGIPR